MPITYTYDFWDGKSVIGKITMLSEIKGRAVIFPILDKKYEAISVPILYLCIKDNGVEYTVRRVLDVRRKSKRQRYLLCKRDE